MFRRHDRRGPASAGALRLIERDTDRLETGSGHCLKRATAYSITPQWQWNRRRLVLDRCLRKDELFQCQWWTLTLSRNTDPVTRFRVYCPCQAADSERA